MEVQAASQSNVPDKGARDYHCQKSRCRIQAASHGNIPTKGSEPIIAKGPNADGNIGFKNWTLRLSRKDLKWYRSLDKYARTVKKGRAAQAKNIFALLLESSQSTWTSNDNKRAQQIQNGWINPRMGGTYKYKHPRNTLSRSSDLAIYLIVGDHEAGITQAWLMTTRYWHLP